MDKSLKVLIVGGGMGGLCLANGLKNAGVSCEVFERDESPAARTQGYRIRINPDGSGALHSCLSPDLFKLFVDTCGKRGGQFAFVTEQLDTLLSIPETDDPNEIRSNRSVSRVILRQVLLSGLGGLVKFNKRFVRFEQTNGSVTAFFEDGSSASGDLLIGADGVNSRVREQFLPQAAPVNTGALGIAAKLPLTDRVREILSPECLSGSALVMGPHGRSMFVARQEFDERSVQNAFRDDTENYAFWGFLTRREALGSEVDPSAMQPAERRDLVLEQIADWHERLRQLVSESDLTTTATWPMRHGAKLEPWNTTNVTLLGDAIHSMPPTGGIGGNIALRDAELLTAKLAQVQQGRQSLLDSVHEYEVEMFKYAGEAVEFSVGLLARATSDNQVRLAGRKAFFRVVDKMPGVKRKMFSR